MFRGKTTKDSFHCAMCGKDTETGRVFCKDCSKKIDREKLHYEMTSTAPGTQRMERLD